VKKIAKSFLFLYLLYSFLFVFPKQSQTCAAGNVAGVNIGPNYDMFAGAASLVGPGGWVYVLGQIGDCGSYEELFSQAGSVNIIIRGHYPNTTLELDLAKSWAATLANMNTNGHKVFFMPVNEPNNAQEVDGNGQNHTPDVVKSYTDTLLAELDKYGVRGSKVVVLSPLLDQHNASYDSWYSALGGAAYFNNFDGISMNLYDLRAAGGALSYDGGDAISRNAGRYKEFAKSKGYTKPIYAVESGAIVDGRVQYVDKETAEFVRRAGPIFNADSNFKMFGIFAYDPHYAREWDLTTGSTSTETRAAYAGVRSSGSPEMSSVDQSKLSSNIESLIKSGQLESCGDSCGTVVKGRNDLCKGSSINNRLLKRRVLATSGLVGYSETFDLVEKFTIGGEFALEEEGNQKNANLFAGGHFRISSLTDPADRDQVVRFGGGVVSKGLRGVFPTGLLDDFSQGARPSILFPEPWANYLRFDYQIKCALGTYLLGECITSSMQRYTDFCPPPELLDYSQQDPTPFTPARTTLCKNKCDTLEKWKTNCKQDWELIPMFDNPDVLVKQAAYIKGCNIETGHSLAGGTLVTTVAHQVRGMNNVTSALNLMLNNFSDKGQGFSSSGAVGNETSPIIGYTGPDAFTIGDIKSLDSYFGFSDFIEGDSPSKYKGDKTAYERLTPPFDSSSPLPAKGKAMYYGLGVMEQVYQNRINWGDIDICNECIGQVALLREGDLNRRVYIKLPFGADYEGPYQVIDTAARKDVGDLFAKGWAVDVGYSVWQAWQQKYPGKVPQGPIDGVIIVSVPPTGANISGPVEGTQYSYSESSTSKPIESLNIIPKLKNLIGLKDEDTTKIVAQTYPVRTLQFDDNWNPNVCGQLNLNMQVQIYPEGGGYRIEWMLQGNQAVNTGFSDIQVKLPNGQDTGVSKWGPTGSGPATYCSSGFQGCATSNNGYGPVNAGSLPTDLFATARIDECHASDGQSSGASCTINKDGTSTCLSSVVGGAPACTPPQIPENYKTENSDSIDIENNQMGAFGNRDYSCTVEIGGDGKATCKPSESLTYKMWLELKFAEHDKIFSSLTTKDGKGGVMNNIFAIEGIEPEFNKTENPILAGVTSTAVRYCDSTTGTPGGKLVDSVDYENDGCFDQVRNGIRVFPKQIGHVIALADWVQNELLNINKKGNQAPNTDPVNPNISVPPNRPGVVVGDEKDWVFGGNGVAQINNNAQNSTYFPSDLCSLESGKIQVNITAQSGEYAGVFFNGALDDVANPKGYLAVLKFTEPKGLYLYINDGANEYNLASMKIAGFVSADLKYDTSYRVVINTSIEKGKHSVQVTGAGVSVQADLLDSQFASGRVGYYTNKAEATFTGGYTNGNCELDTIIEKPKIPTSITTNSGVEVYATTVFDYNFGDYLGKFSPAPPHAQGNSNTAVKVIWRSSTTKSKVQDQELIFWKERANVPFFQLPYLNTNNNKFTTMGVSFGYLDGNLPHINLVNQYGRLGDNSIVNILKNKSDEVVIEWIYYVTDSTNAGTNRQYKVVEYYYIYPSGVVFRQAKIIDSFSENGFSNKNLTASIISPVGKIWSNTLQLQDTQVNKTGQVIALDQAKQISFFGKKEGVNNPLSNTVTDWSGDTINSFGLTTPKILLIEPSGYNVFAVTGGYGSKIVQDPEFNSYASYINTVIGSSVEVNRVVETVDDVNTYPTEAFLVGLQSEETSNNNQILNTIYIVKKDKTDTLNDTQIAEIKTIGTEFVNSLAR